MLSFLKGYRTYIVAIGGILTSLGAYLGDQIDLTAMIVAILGFLSMMGLRAATK